jgi:hypothetical protein
MKLGKHERRDSKKEMYKSLCFPENSRYPYTHSHHPSIVRLPIQTLDASVLS